LNKILKKKSLGFSKFSTLQDYELEIKFNMQNTII